MRCGSLLFLFIFFAELSFCCLLFCILKRNAAHVVYDLYICTKFTLLPMCQWVEVCYGLQQRRDIVSGVSDRKIESACMYERQRERLFIYFILIRKHIFNYNYEVEEHYHIHTIFKDILRKCEYAQPCKETNYIV